MTYYNKYVEVLEGNVVEEKFEMIYIKRYYASAKLNCAWLQSAKVQLSHRIGFDESFSEYSPECNSNTTIQYLSRQYFQCLPQLCLCIQLPG
jgi:hypothetical protein